MIKIGGVNMRCPIAIATYFVLTGAALAGTTTTIDIYGLGPMSITVRGALAAATTKDCDCPWGGTVGKVKGLGTVLTLGGTPSAINDKARFWVIQYPLVNDGWWYFYRTDGQKTALLGTGTYTVEGSAASVEPH